MIQEPNKIQSTAAPIAIRFAEPEDDAKLARLADLDCAPLPRGTHLIAEQANAPLAAISVASGAAIADPFKPTADIVSILRMRRRQLELRKQTERPRRRLFGRDRSVDGDLLGSHA